MAIATSIPHATRTMSAALKRLQDDSGLNDEDNDVAAGCVDIRPFKRRHERIDVSEFASSTVEVPESSKSTIAAPESSDNTIAVSGSSKGTTAAPESSNSTTNNESSKPHNTPTLDDDDDDDDEDYLSSKYIANLPPTPPKPHKPIPSKRELKQLEEEQTQRGLQQNLLLDKEQDDTPAMRMMKSMGYVASNNETLLPIMPDLHRRHPTQRAGIGRIVGFDHVKDDADRNHQKEVEDFRTQTARVMREARDQKLLQRALRVLDELDERIGAGEEEEQTLRNDADLDTVVCTLRDRHHYCLFCGCQYHSTDDLLSSCPGVTEQDHDD